MGQVDKINLLPVHFTEEKIEKIAFFRNQDLN